MFRVMSGDQSAEPYATRASLLLRLNASDPRPREIAWQEFRDRYSPVIAGFARNLGAMPQDIDDVIQDVLLGFYARSPTFTYDPDKGRFRGYLKVCTFRALRARLGHNARFKALPLDQLQEEDVEIDHVWTDVWAQEQLNRALTAVRDDYHGNKTFQAFQKHVIEARPAEEVAAELGMSAVSVRKAKQRITHALSRRLKHLQDEEG